MRSGEEVRQAIAILGTTFASTAIRKHVWGDYQQTAHEAWAALEALGWVEGVNEAGFRDTLEYARLKLAEYAEQKETSHAE
jgi:hypothetical protein